MQCMMHCKHGTRIVGLVEDAYGWEWIGHVHNHIRFKNTFMSTQTLLAILSLVIGYASHAIYKSHLVLLKENKPVSRDSDLQSLFDCIIRAATDHMLALEETVHNGMDLEEEEEEEFADFVFDAATDVNTELLDE